MVQKSAKDMTWQKKSFQRQGINGMRIESNDLILSTKDYAEKNYASAYINNVDEARLEYYRVFAEKIKPLPPAP